MKHRKKVEAQNDPIHDEIVDLETHILDLSEGGGAVDYALMGIYRQAFHIDRLGGFIDILKVSKLPDIKRAARSSLVAFRKAESIEESFFRLLRRGTYVESEDGFIASDRPSTIKLHLTEEAFIKKVENKYARLLAEKIQQKDEAFFRRITNHFKTAVSHEKKDSVEVSTRSIVLAAWPYSFWLMEEPAASTFFTYCKRLIERDSPQLFDRIKDMDLFQENFRKIKKREALVSTKPPLIHDIVFNTDLKITAVKADPSIYPD